MTERLLYTKCGPGDMETEIASLPEKLKRLVHPTKSIEVGFPVFGADIIVGQLETSFIIDIQLLKSVCKNTGDDVDLVLVGDFIANEAMAMFEGIVIELQNGCGQ